MDKQALFHLVSSGDFDKLRSLIQTHSMNGLDLDVVNDQGYSLISIAAAEGREDIVKLLIDSGVQFGRNGDFRPLGSDWDPLHLAARRCRLSVVKLLTESGADINAKDYKGNTVLGNGLIGGDVTIVQYLIDEGAKFTLLPENPLNFALRSLSLPLIQKLTSLGQFGFEATKEGGPLHYIIHQDSISCCYPGHNEATYVNIFKYLLQVPSVDIDQDFGDEKGSPLNYAFRLRRYPLVSLLIKAGANVSKLDLSHFKFSSDSMESLKLLYYSGYQFVFDGFSKNSYPSLPKDVRLRRDFGIVCYRPSCGWITDEEYEKEVLAFHEFCRWLERKRFTTERLQILAVMTIRQYFRKDLNHLLNVAQIPQSLKALVKLTHLV